MTQTTYCFTASAYICMLIRRIKCALLPRSVSLCSLAISALQNFKKSLGFLCSIIDHTTKSVQIQRNLQTELQRASANRYSSVKSKPTLILTFRPRQQWRQFEYFAAKSSSHTITPEMILMFRKHLEMIFIFVFLKKKKIL